MSALNNNYLPDLNNDSAVIETADHYYIFDDTFDPGVLQDFRRSNQPSGWEQVRDNQLHLMRRIVQLDSQAARKDERIMNIHEKFTESDIKCRSLFREKQWLQLDVLTLKEEVKKLRGILKEEGIELEEALRDDVEMDTASKGKGRAEDESQKDKGLELLLGDALESPAPFEQRQG